MGCLPSQHRVPRAVLGALASAAILLAAGPLSARPAPPRLLRGLDVRPGRKATEIRVHLSAPVRLVRATPAGPADLVRIELVPLGDAPGTREPSPVREALAAPGGPVPLLDVVLRREFLPARLELRFARPVAHAVRLDRDLRSLVVAVSEPAPAPAGAARAAEAAAPIPAEAAGDPGDPTPRGSLLREARDALAAGELERAIALFTHLAEPPEHAASAEARELLGVARERKGQLAHARAEYETYLARYPEGEGAERVRQRLQALVTARAEAAEPLRPAQPARGTAAPGGAPARLAAFAPFDFFGSMGSTWLRDARRTDATGRVVAVHGLVNQVLLGVRGGTPALDLRGELAGSYVFDFDEKRRARERIDSLFVEVEEREGPWGGGAGRLPGNTGGVIGGLDGGRATLRLGERFSVSALAGFPVDPWESSDFDPSRQLYGVHVDAEGLLDVLDGQLFAVQQRVQGLVDRSSVGGELRYAKDALFAAAYLDVDVGFGVLNTAFLTGNWQVTKATSLNWLLDTRTLPTLTLRNALIGQTDDSLDDLRDRLGTGGLEDLARDRTARSRLASLGVTHRLSDRFQVAADASLSDLTGTPPSEGVPGFEGTGLQWAGSLQLVGTSLLRAGDVHTVGLRLVRAETVDVAGLVLSVRQPLGRRVWATPLLYTEWRRPERGEDVFSLRPGLRLDWRIGPVTLDAEGLYVWERGERFPGLGDETGVQLLVGLRYDF